MSLRQIVGSPLYSDNEVNFANDYVSVNVGCVAAAAGQLSRRAGGHPAEGRGTTPAGRSALIVHCPLAVPGRHPAAPVPLRRLL